MIEMSVRDMLKSAEAQSASAATMGGGALGAMPMERRELSDLAKRIAQQASVSPYSPAIIGGLLRAVDFAVVLGIGIGIYLTYVWPTYGFQWVSGLSAGAISVLTVFMFQACGLYELPVWRSVPQQSGRLFVAWTLVFMVALSASFLLKTGDQLSRIWLMSWFFTGLSVLFTLRVILTGRVRDWTRAGRLQRRAVLVGGGEPAAELIRSINAQADSDVQICGFFDDRYDDRSPAEAEGTPKLGSVDDLVEFARQTRVDVVLMTLPITAESRVLAMLRKLWVLPVDVRLSAHAAKLRFRPRAYSYIGNVPVLDVFDRPIAEWDLVLKSVFDRVVGVLAIIALAPLLIVTAIAVKLDSKGPILFRQKRYGFNNEMIEVFKFRSLRVEQEDATAAKQVTKDDPRVTRVGRIIRRTSIDELPQLFNVVFTGNLSLVGPRPHAVHAKAANQLYNDVVDGYFARHKVKPGITGWAQINGWRGETDTEEKIQNRVEHDLFYIENWSILFDIYILIKTPFSLLKHRDNAY